MWGADVVEVPRGDRSFKPKHEGDPASRPISTAASRAARASRPTGTRSRFAVRSRPGPSSACSAAAWTPSWPRRRSRSRAATRCRPGASSSPRPTRRRPTALDEAGEDAGIWFERGIGAKPARTLVTRAPKIGVLVNSATPETSTTTRPIFEGLEAVFGPDVSFVSTVNGPNSLQNAATDPLAGIDVLYNTGTAYPRGDERDPGEGAADRVLRPRRRLHRHGPVGDELHVHDRRGLVDAFTRGIDDAGGGIALWDNVGGAASPLTGAYPARDTLFLPSSMTYFSAIPTGAAVDGRYLGSTADTVRRGPLARPRRRRRPGAPMIVHGSDDGEQPLPGLRDRSVLAHGRRAGVDAHRAGRPLVEPDGRLAHLS